MTNSKTSWIIIIIIIMITTFTHKLIYRYWSDREHLHSVPLMPKHFQDKSSNKYWLIAFYTVLNTDILREAVCTALIKLLHP